MSHRFLSADSGLTAISKRFIESLTTVSIWGDFILEAWQARLNTDRQVNTRGSVYHLPLVSLDHQLLKKASGTPEPCQVFADF